MKNFTCISMILFFVFFSKISFGASAKRIKREQIAAQLMQIAYSGEEGSYKTFKSLIRKALQASVSEKEILELFAKKTTKDNNIKNDSLEEQALQLALFYGREEKLKIFIGKIKQKLRLSNFLRIRRMLPSKIVASPSVSPVPSEGAEEAKANI
jgi:hypothetical protein